MQKNFCSIAVILLELNGSGKLVAGQFRALRDTSGLFDIDQTIPVATVARI